MPGVFGKELLPPESWYETSKYASKISLNLVLSSLHATEYICPSISRRAVQGCTLEYKQIRPALGEGEKNKILRLVY
jgi:hypothetical protein